MPDVAGPFDLGSWSQAQWYRDAYARDRSGVYGLPAATLNDGDLSLAVNGLNWAVNLGRAHIRGSGYERTGSTVTGAFPANTSSNPRVDRLVLRRDLAAKTVTVVRLQGTPAASPMPPSLTRVEDGIWDLPLHRVTVPANSGTVLTNPVDERPWLGTSGLQPIRSRFVVATASGTLASGATANLCAPQVLPASVFDLGVPYQLDIDARLQMSIPSGAGAKLELFVNGALAGQDNVGNGGSGPATYTLKVRDVAYRTTDDQVTVSAVLTAIAGGLSSIGSGRLFITAQPYMAL